MTVEQKFQLDYCLDWILENGFTRIVLQLKKEDLKFSVQISNYLREKYRLLSKSAKLNTSNTSEIDLYISQSRTCCIDLLVIQHVAEVQAVIHFGKVCLSEPAIKNPKVNPSILFVFGHLDTDEGLHSGNIDSIISRLDVIRNSNLEAKVCIMYDTNLIDYAIKIQEISKVKTFQDNVHVARLVCPNEKWSSTRDHESWIVNKDEMKSQNFGHYVIEDPIASYDYAIYLGERLSIQTILSGPPNFIQFTYNQGSQVTDINVSKVLNKRMALVTRLKDEEDLKIGVIITNPLPDLNEAIKRLKNYAKSRRHTLYFISMVQTIDEYKIGNFDLCDAFIVINSCNCSTILESLVFNRPIITELEFKLACGFEAHYGGVNWPGSSLHPSDDDLMIRRKVSDVSMALIHTRNELLERCSQSRANKWSGMDYKSSQTGATDGESLTINQGLKGMACTYESEPLDKDLEGS